MGFVSRHSLRDNELPLHREKLLQKFLKLNKALCLMTGLAENEDKILQMIDMVL